MFISRALEYKTLQKNRLGTTVGLTQCVNSGLFVSVGQTNGFTQRYYTATAGCFLTFSTRFQSPLLAKRGRCLLEIFGAGEGA